MKVTCPHCKQVLESNEMSPGMEVECYCGKSFIIPKTRHTKYQETTTAEPEKKERDWRKSVYILMTTGRIIVALPALFFLVRLIFFLALFSADNFSFDLFLFDLFAFGGCIIIIGVLEVLTAIVDLLHRIERNTRT